MGIKSTQTISRSRALAMLAEMRGDLIPTNKEIADELDQLWEARAAREGGVCFDNFEVVDDDQNPDIR